MKLRDYLSQHEISLAAFARQIGVANASVVQRYSNGDRIPQRDIMQRITEATDGAVQANDFFSPDEAPASQSDAAA